jgi:hypothetical protein
MMLPGDRIEETEGRGVIIRSNPAGARIFIDGIERGKTPLKLENLRPGQYFFRLEKEGYVSRRFRVLIPQGSVLDITIEMDAARGKVLVKVSPAPGGPGPEALPLIPLISADVEVKIADGSLLTLPVGFRTIKVRAFGWEENSSTVYVGEGTVQILEIGLRPAAFRVTGAALRRPRFNPGGAGSLGTTEIGFEVSAPGEGTFSVFDSRGDLVFARELGPFTGWSQTSFWNGRDRWGAPLPDGEYSLVLKLRSLSWDSSAPVEETFILTAAVDSSQDIRPLALSSGKAGLLFAPAAAPLPPGSFQIDSGLLFGSPPVAGRPWKSLPFAAGFRFSPLNRLEISAALNMLPVSGEDIRPGVAGTAKWVFADPGRTGFFGFAAGAVFSWAEKTSATSFGMGSGIELFFPLQFNIRGPFSFLFTPACIWTGDDGFPWEGVPRFLVSGGFLARLTYITAGLSLRSEYRFTNEEPRSPSLMIGGEVKFFPPPSSFVFSVMGGLWIKDGAAGGFGGAGIGLIY